MGFLSTFGNRKQDLVTLGLIELQFNLLSSLLKCEDVTLRISVHVASRTTLDMSPPYRE